MYISFMMQNHVSVLIQARVIHHDQIAYRYEILPLLGRGAFGTVCKAFDHKTKQLVALKILRNKTNFHERGDMEVKILHYLNDQDSDGSYNIVKLHEGFIFRKHLILSFELLGCNLYELLKKNCFTGLKLSLINRFAAQILQSLRLTKKVRLIHGDIRLENIVLVSNQKANIKLIDFSSSQFEEERLFTYIQSRFYRAPEVILGCPYAPAVDMWSLGCVL